MQISLLALEMEKKNTTKTNDIFFIKLPDDITVKNEKELPDFVFGGIENNYTDSAWLSSRSIIFPTNSEVDAINNTIMSIFSGDVKLYRINDSVEENENQYAIEFLNSLCPSRMRPHTLQLRKHSITMLLRNLDPVKGHCNGARYVIEHLHDHIIDATIACGPRTGKQIFIARIAKIPSDNILPFHMKRKQFLVRPAFAITSNIAQGQTLSHVGIYLKQGFFSQGLLYVAMSRVGSKDSLKIYSDHGVYTSNVVDKEVLRQ